MASTRGCHAPIPTAVAVPTMAKKASRNPNSCHVLYCRDSKSDMAITGASSPTVPTGKSRRPSGVSRSPISPRIGISMPSAVVHTASVTIIGAWTFGMMCRRPTTPSPTSSDTPQPQSASTSGRPFIAAKSSSMPAMNNVVAMPKMNIASSMPVSSTNLRTCGPMRIPSRTSNTTTGTLKPSGTRDSKGAATAASINQKMG
jgi:hypothetical protein